MAQIQNCVEMGFPALSSLFKCYRMFSSLFMDQINIQSFCQVESELFLQGLPKINADRSPPISHIKRLGGNFCRRGRKRQYKKLITESILSIGIPDSKLSWIERKSVFIEIWTRPLSMANHSNQKCPCGSERYHRYCRHRKWKEFPGLVSYLRLSNILIFIRQWFWGMRQFKRSENTFGRLLRKKIWRRCEEMQF